MEDTYIVHEVSLYDGQKAMLFGVFDGHGGDKVSKFVKKVFYSTLIAQ